MSSSGGVVPMIVACNFNCSQYDKTLVFKHKYLTTVNSTYNINIT